MSYFNDLNSDLTPIGITFTAVSWLNIFGIVQINPLLQSIVYLMTIAWLGMQMYAFLKKQFNKKS
jgi:hypothetical protein